jgi:hypothetical protein
LRISLILIILLIVGNSPDQPMDSQALSLQPQQGRYFRWAAPPGWRVSETNAGVTLTSPA